MKDVLFAPMDFNRYDPDETLPARFDRLLERSPLKGGVKDKTVAIKYHVGDRLGYTTIAPIFIRKLVTFIQDCGGKCFLTDHYVWQRDPAKRGYTPEILGCPIVDDCGVTGKYFVSKDVDFKTFKNVDIAGEIYHADYFVDLSHVKGHGACGFGGAVKNISMGCVTDRTRHQIHGLAGGLEWDESKCTHCKACLTSCNHGANFFDEDGRYKIDDHNCTLCHHCEKVCPADAINITDSDYYDFQHGMALATKTVLDCFAPENRYFINVLLQVTALCDCWGMSTPALVPDVGILASEDIVAVEQASLDMIKNEDLIPKGAPGGQLPCEGEHLFERLHGLDPFVQLDKLQEMGVGSRKYQLVEVR